MELTVDQALQQGVAAHKEGRFQDAERFYRAILQAQPKHPDANHNLGLLAVVVGKPLEAIPLFKLALEVNPKIEQFWLSYIDALITVEHFDEAQRVLVEGEKSGVSSDKLDAPSQRLQGSVPNDPTKTAKGQTLSEKKKVQGDQSIAEPSQEQINHLLGHYQAGRLAEAEVIATLFTKQFPRHPFGWKVLGATLKQTGRLIESQLPTQKAAELSPQDAKAHNNLGATLRELGRLDEAKASYEQAIAVRPDYVEAHSSLGVTLRELGRLDEAEASYRQAITLKPDLAEAHSNLGNTLQELGRFDESEASYRQAIALKPDLADAHSNLGNTLKELGRLNESEASYRQAISLEPHYAEAHSNLGNTLKELGRLDESEASLRQAIALKPDLAEAHSNLGNTLQELWMLDESEASYGQAIALKPDLADAHSNLGNTLKELGRLNEAEASLRQAIALKPDYAEAHSDLGNTLKEMGRLDEAEASYKKAIALKPDFFEARDNLLFVLNYDHRLSAADLYGEYAMYGEAVTGLTKRRFAHDYHAPVSGRRIRVGYSSPDFRSHACLFFMEPIFRHHNRDEFELFAYSNTRQPDVQTGRLKGYFDHWVDVTSLSDDAMAERIYNDGVDILVDMAGHTAGNRLLVFAMRPAPIQVSSPIGYGYTTGLNEVDYFIGDENLTPLGSEPYFAEKLWRMPAPNFAYEPPREVAPDVSDLPALRKGYVTFGSLTRTVRLNDSVFGVWKEILNRVPNSRLRLDQKPFIADSARELFWARLEEIGILRERVELVCTKPHWAAFHEIDITLDCWPHNAGTTTIESLWMGVPVLSKIDRPSTGCVGASILRPAGLGDWVVDSEIEYVERAATFSADLTELAKLRAGLRQQFEVSPILDGAGLTCRIEVAYKKMLDLLQRTG
jgi:predicted O-linked N-acetylglucosamine transferase (SPINDLY family)